MIDAEAVVCAVAAAAAVIPHGQVPAAIAAAHGAVSRTLGLGGGGAAGPGAAGLGAAAAAEVAAAGAARGARVAALASLVAAVLASLPAPPGDPLPQAAAAALKELTREIEGRLGDWHCSIGGASDINDAVAAAAASTKRATAFTKGGRAAEVDDAAAAAAAAAPGVGAGAAGEAAVAGALLKVYTPAAALLECSHAGHVLHNNASTAYLGHGGPPLAAVVAALLGGGGGDGGAGGKSGALGTAGVALRGTAAAAAGAALHRVSQLARAARQPPAGDGDEGAAAEARVLVACMLHAAAANDAPAPGSMGMVGGAVVGGAVRELLVQCMDIWVEWAPADHLRYWVRGGGGGASTEVGAGERAAQKPAPVAAPMDVGVFEDPKLLTLWGRQAARSVLEAAAAVARSLACNVGWRWFKFEPVLEVSGLSSGIYNMLRKLLLSFHVLLSIPTCALIPRELGWLQRRSPRWTQPRSPPLVGRTTVVTTTRRGCRVTRSARRGAGPSLPETAQDVLQASTYLPIFVSCVAMLPA